MKKTAAGKRQKQAQTELSSKGLLSWALGSTTVKLVLVILGFILLFFVYAATRPPPPPPTISFYQETLKPVTGLKILPGEKYSYRFGDSGYGLLVEHSVIGRTEGCMAVTTDFSGAALRFCLDERTGETVSFQGSSYPVPGGARESLFSPSQEVQKPSPEFAQPWMLSVRENWTWANELNTTSEFMGASESIQTRAVYRFVSTEEMKGRTALKVSVETSMNRVSNDVPSELGNSTETVWIDSEKRVLLYATSSGVSSELVSAPFNVTLLKK